MLWDGIPSWSYKFAHAGSGFEKRSNVQTQKRAPGRLSMTRQSSGIWCEKVDPHPRSGKTPAPIWARS